MRKSIPANPNLNYLKKEAKELKRTVDQKNYSVSYRIAVHARACDFAQLYNCHAVCLKPANL